MANPEHLEILKQGVEVWNERWEENFNITNVDSSSPNLYALTKNMLQVCEEGKSTI